MGGVTISASPATINIPTGYLVNESGDNYIRRTITIPNGIHVIEVYVHCFVEMTHIENYVYIGLQSNNKQWYSGNDLFNKSWFGYIGVTPNKQYTASLTCDSDERDAYIKTFYIKYSPEINNKTPTIYDY